MKTLSKTKLFNLLLLSCVALNFVACDSAKSVGYYEKHPQEAQNKVTECGLKALPVALGVSSESEMERAMKKAYGRTFIKECKNAYAALEELKNASRQAKKKKNPQSNAKSVEYYKKNSREAKERIGECSDLEFEYEWQYKEFAKSKEGKKWYQECENAATALGY